MYIFEGTATDDHDKLHLMQPILGLYAALFAIYFYVHKGANLLVAEGLLCEGARTPPPPPVWWLYASWGGSMVLAGTVAVCFPGLLGRAR